MHSIGTISNAGRLGVLLLAVLGLSRPAAWGAEMPEGARNFFSDHCLDCHTGDDAEASFDLDRLLRADSFDRHASHWKGVFKNVVGGIMPPDEMPRPESAEIEPVVAWLRGELARVEKALAAQSPRPMRRLNRQEYNNTIRDLFGLDLRPADDFPLDEALHGFDNVAQGLSVSSLHIENYLAAAQQVLDEAIVLGERPESARTQYDFMFYFKNPHKSDSPLWVRDGNGFLVLESKEKCWLGGPFFVKFKAPVAGRYRVTLHGKPHQFSKGLLSIVGYAEDREVLSVDVTPAGAADGELLTYEGRFEAGLVRQVEFEWVNGHELNADGNFRALQAAKKGRQVLSAWPEGLDWPYVRDLRVIVEGPLNDVWPPRSTRRVLGEDPHKTDARAVVQRFLPRVFRRPITATELEHYATRIEREQQAGASFAEAVKFALAGALVSPDFLYLVETPPPDAARGEYRLSDYELASRLSYFLWSSMPDGELFRTARQGKLRDPQELDAQVVRMLRASKARALTDGFAEQWLGTRRIPSLMPEPTIFREFDEELHLAIAGEPLALFDRVRQENLSLVTFLDSNFLMLNERLARHYEIEGVEGRSFRPVPIDDDSRRGGLVTQAGFLTLTSEATRTSPVKRGIWILERLFNRPPDPPPPNVGTLNEELDAEVRSIRTRLEKHQEVTACAACHRRIDPYGLALESFDAVGQWRTEEQIFTSVELAKPHWERKPKTFEIDAQVEFPGGGQAEGVAGLKQHLLDRQDDFVRGLTEKMMIYALGRDLLLADEPEIERILAALEKDDYHFETLIRQVVQTRAFQHR